MSRKLFYTPEQMSAKHVPRSRGGLGAGPVGLVKLHLARFCGVSEQSYYRWRQGIDGATLRKLTRPSV